jgi:hypothetical protein
MIIDFHTHIVPPGVKQNREEYARKDKGFASIYSDPKAILVTAEELITAMDKDEVDISVALNYAWATQSLCIETNNYILEAVARYPQRLIGFCSFSPTEGESAIKELERCIRSGSRGIGELRLDTQFPREDWLENIKPLAELIIKNDLILLIHSSEPLGHQYPGKGKVTPGFTLYFSYYFP